ncbi:hypothetical protein JTB14_002376 [Gonioctena quinquepunctata]|nr:hypothetical protein JTB14_002376 [Gonioctena quinquepunctata]
MSELHHVLNPEGARKLAYDLAIANERKIPTSWENNKIAGKRITIYDIAEISREIYPPAFCLKNVVSAFQAAGVFPFKDDIFNYDDFMAATVIYIPNFVREEQEPNNSNASEIPVIDVQSISTSSGQDKMGKQIRNIHLKLHLQNKLFLVKQYQISRKQPQIDLFLLKKKTTEVQTGISIYERIESETARQKRVKKAKATVKRKINRSVRSTNTKRKKSISSDSSSSDEKLSDVADYDDVSLFSELDGISDRDVTP